MQGAWIEMFLRQHIQSRISKSSLPMRGVWVEI